jgi:3,4-dihydroxy-2-butanone 4-phosphate synthase
MNEPFDTIEEALADIAAGKLVIVTDDENRENEGDLVWRRPRPRRRRST